METKTSFILHLDSLKVLDSLTKEQIADLFLAIRDYNLGAEIKLEGLMKAIFVSFENQFERDNERYLSVIERNRLNGLKGGRPKTRTNPENPVGYLGYSENPLEPKKPDNDNDNDNDNDKDKDNDKDIKIKSFDFKKAFLDLDVDVKILDDWLKVRKTKKAVNSETAFNGIKKKMEASGKSFNECVRISAEKSWAGFDIEWMKEKPKYDNSANITKLKGEIVYEQF